MGLLARLLDRLVDLLMHPNWARRGMVDYSDRTYCSHGQDLAAACSACAERRRHERGVAAGDPLTLAGWWCGRALHDRREHATFGGVL